MAEGGDSREIPDIHACKDDYERKKVIQQAFSLFDMDQQNIVPEAEVPTIMRYLGLFPTQKDVIQTILPAMQGDEPSDVVHYANFEGEILNYLDNNEFAPDGEERLLQAFRVFDPDDTGTVDADKMVELLQSNDQEPFLDKELESFLSVAKDPQTGKIYYEDYINLLCGNKK
eukprot:gb/GECG01012768.1/.p1 GENE.gb/GECG01012768.1/~~gb/GECG01012768.1/.p1  ORF type:complete len:172 (+),score=34.20 gb/GECG01012768.1/:1-516(+)